MSIGAFMPHYYPPLPPITSATLKDSKYAQFSQASFTYPSGISAGDLLIGFSHHTAPGRAFRSASGFIMIGTASSGAGDVFLCYRIADGTESGEIGGFTDNASSMQEWIEVYEFDRPTQYVNDLGISGGATSNGIPSSQTIPIGSVGDAPLMVFCGWGSAAQLTNAHLYSPGGTIQFGTYGVGPSSKSRTFFMAVGDTLTDMTFGFNGDPGNNNAIIAAAIEIR